MARTTAATPDAEVALRFWAALAARDAAGMATCYAPDATFEDEVFNLRGAACGTMWRMLFQSAADLQVETGKLHVDDGVAHGTWEATYTFSGTGRKVHNKIRTRLVLRDGKIADHKDEFPFYKWSRQALGVKGWLLGWTPIVRFAVRRQARRRLERWTASRKVG